jgi:hypothetical protein
MTKFARSITRGSFIPKGNTFVLSDDAKASLGEYADRVLACHNAMVNGTLVTDFSVETEQDGTYDQIQNMIVHWRDDGWVDISVHMNFESAEAVMEHLSDMYYGD